MKQLFTKNSKRIHKNRIVLVVLLSLFSSTLFSISSSTVSQLTSFNFTGAEEKMNNPEGCIVDEKIIDLLTHEESQHNEIGIILTVDRNNFSTIVSQLHDMENIKNLQTFPTFSMISCQIALKNIVILEKFEGIQHIQINSPLLTNESPIISNKVQSETKIGSKLPSLSKSISKIEPNSNLTLLNSTPLADAIGYSALYEYFPDKVSQIKGNNSVIAILDSGIDGLSVLDDQLQGLMDNITPYYDLSNYQLSSLLSDADIAPIINLNLLGAVSFIPYEPLYYTDFTSSGTYHAGIVAGRGYEEIEYHGVVPEAYLLNVKVRDSFGLTYYSFVLSGLEWALSHDADVVLIPWSFPGTYDDPMSIAINIMVDHGVVVVVPTGDEGPAYTSNFAPSQALKAISVGAYDIETQTICDFSSRSPTFDMRVGVDLLAPGKNIWGPTAVLQNATFLQKSSTSAAAAITAGACAILISLFPTATPEMIKIALLKTAHPLSITYDPNTYGAGTLNISAAGLFLQNYLSSNFKISDRAIQTSFYPGAIINADIYNITSSLLKPDDWDPYNVFAMTGSQAMITALLVMNSSDNLDTAEIDLHLPANQFALSFNETVVTFSEMDVVREMDMITRAYDPSFYTRYTSILRYESLYIPIVVESWSYTYEDGPWDFVDFEDLYVLPVGVDFSGRITAFRFSFSFINYGLQEYANLTLHSYMKSDLYLNEQGIFQTDEPLNATKLLAAGNDDEHYYNATYETLYSVDQYTEGENATMEWTAVGMNSTSHSLAGWEINTTNNIFGHLFTQDRPQWSNSSESQLDHEDEDFGYGQSWLLSTKFSPGETLNFSAILSVGKGMNQSIAVNKMFQMMKRIIQNVTAPLIQDLAIVQTSIPRMEAEGVAYITDAIIINLGTIAYDSASVYFTANCTSTELVSDLYSKTFQISDLNPMEMVEFHARWIFSYEGLFEIGWQIGGINSQWTIEDDNTINNQQKRMVFIYDYSHLISELPDLIMMIPSLLPVNPFIVHYPGDVAQTNFTIISPLELGECSLIVTGQSPEILSIDTLSWYSTEKTAVLQANMMIPLFFRKGAYLLNLHFFSNFQATHMIIPIYFEIEENQGRVLFDGIHKQIIPDFGMEGMGLGDLSNLESLGITNSLSEGVNLNALFEERMETLYGNYVTFHDALSLSALKGIAMTQMIQGLDFTELMGGDFASSFDSDTGILGDTNESLALQRLFKGDNFFNFGENVTSDIYSYDLIKFFDSVIFTAPDIAFTDDELAVLSRYLDLGGNIFLFLENKSTQNLEIAESLLSLAEIEIMTQNIGNTTIFTNESWSDNLKRNCSSVIFHDPLSLHSQENSTTAITWLNSYIGIASVGKGHFIAVGDNDWITQEYIEEADNYIFIQNLFQEILSDPFDFSVTLRDQVINYGESTYISLSVDNLDIVTELEEDFLALVFFQDDLGNSIEAKLFGFDTPMLPLLRVNNSNFIAQFDSSWVSPYTSVRVSVILDSPVALSESFTFTVEIQSTSIIEEFEPYQQPPPETPLFLEAAFVFLALTSISVIWLYSSQKWKLRHRYIAITVEIKGKIDNFLSSFQNSILQINEGIESDQLDEIEKIRYILKNEKDISHKLDDLKDIASEMGEK